MAITFQDGPSINPQLSDLVVQIGRDVEATTRPAPRVAETMRHALGSLAPESLVTGLETAASEAGYAQHCVHVDPIGRFSVVALVWKAGQFTPVHNHRCWGVVSVLEGIESETSYDVAGVPGDDFRIREAGLETFRAGDVCYFEPPEDVHLVMNAGRDLAMSLHVYGCDYRDKPTSILDCFDGAIEIEGTSIEPCD